ncbi:MAG TPA: hypothetical protein VG917_01740 [Patescibacteria group bacterium]|nr:hypothetical protein [Patescibacteria group bacterium]
MGKIHTQSRNKKRIYFVLALFLILVVGYFVYKFIDPLYNETRTWNLIDVQMAQLGKEVKDYKSIHGKYPTTLSEIRPSESICTDWYVIFTPIKYQKCVKVSYEVRPDLQDFRMAAIVDTGTVAYYHPEICMTWQEYQKLSKEEAARRIKKYGSIHTSCQAYAEGTKVTKPSSIPVYREDKKIFSNPSEWPRL